MQPNDLYLYVVVQEDREYYATGGDARVKTRLEQASGVRCLVIPFQEFNMSVVENLRPRAIAMSGFGRWFRQHKVEWFFGINEVVHNAHLPMICFCGSHQLLAFCYNKNLREIPDLTDEPMRRLDAEDDLPRRAVVNPDVPDLAHYFIADGFYPIFKVKDDPLFDGLADVMTMRCAHYCEVKTLPTGFDVLARSKHCAIEAMKHRSRPLYGTQFHPEAYENPFLDGQKLLHNFARIVDGFWRSGAEDEGTHA
jgi:GMP synthase-like glutamine amidotransferase